eukprot:Rhum_TRINITY_DN12036_c0_g2::Rhum_TRINITY_DN12036_c0_g2_i1::g.48616::m.48616
MNVERRRYSCGGSPPGAGSDAANTAAGAAPSCDGRSKAAASIGGPRRSPWNQASAGSEGGGEAAGTLVATSLKKHVADRRMPSHRAKMASREGGISARGWGGGERCVCGGGGGSFDHYPCSLSAVVVARNWPKASVRRGLLLLLVLLLLLLLRLHHVRNPLFG